MSLKEYARKRDFKLTAEPGPKLARRGATHRFVVQKHAASHLHYDFRLELDGTLKSWAVPKGIPFAKGEKRLAMQVEDHPVGYIDFEGVIPAGQYGGGTVMVWDAGTYEITGKPELAKGKLHFRLHGHKLEGDWYLVQMRGGKEWLLIRGGEDMRPVSKKQDDTSALSGKSMVQLARGDRLWANGKTRLVAEKKKPRSKTPPPKFFEPMKARLVSGMPEDEGWIYEVKFDGFRALAFKRGEAVDLLSRNEKDFAGKFPEVVGAVAALGAADCVLDGEIVALDAKGRSSFQLLQAFALGQERPPIFYYVFDLPQCEGRDLRRLPLEKRKELLREVVRDAPPVIRYSASLAGEPQQLLAQTRKLGLEGLIGKRADSIYTPGGQGGAWIKIKLRNEQEMVIGGYTPPEGSRQHFGALLLGYYEGGKLLFAGKVGTGFNAALLRSLHERFGKIASPDCPFANLPEKRSARYGQAITATQMSRCHWVKPVMVCQVRFAEWTRDGKLRQPAFLGLREDKDAREVTREKAK